MGAPESSIGRSSALRLMSNVRLLSPTTLRFWARPATGLSMTARVCYVQHGFGSPRPLPGRLDEFGLGRLQRRIVEKNSMQRIEFGGKLRRGSFRVLEGVLVMGHLKTPHAAAHIHQHLQHTGKL